MYPKISEIRTELQKFDEYYRSRGGGTATYFGIDTGTHRYLCRIGYQSNLYPFISPSLLQAIALRPTIENCTRVPRLFDYVPRMTKIELQFSSITPPDLVVRKGRTKLFWFDEETVYTLGGPRISEEVENRRLLPEELPVPKIVEYDKEYPYYAEELIRGTHPTRSLEEWDTFERVFRELYILYDEFSGELLDVDEFIAECESHQLKNRTLEAIDDYGVPKYLPVTRVHADLAHKNIILSDGMPYILDWERSRKEMLISDFFHLIIDICRGRNSTGTIADMILEQGNAYQILQRYLKIVSPLLEEYESGVPLLYFLYRVSRVDHPQESKYYEILDSLLYRLGY